MLFYIAEHGKGSIVRRYRLMQKISSISYNSASKIDHLIQENKKNLAYDMPECNFLTLNAFSKMNVRQKQEMHPAVANHYHQQMPNIQALQEQIRITTPQSKSIESTNGFCEQNHLHFEVRPALKEYEIQLKSTVYFQKIQKLRDLYLNILETTEERIQY